MEGKMRNLELLYLSGADIENINLSIETAIDAVEMAFKLGIGTMLSR